MDPLEDSMNVVDGAAPETQEIPQRLPEEEYADIVAADVNKLEALLKQYEDEKDEREAEESARAARSPMSLVWEVVGCQFAKMNLPADKNIPTYEFLTHPCIFGKSQPDQDCRTCAHVTYHRVGMNQPDYEKRYLNTGTVTPVTEEEMDAIAEFLKERGIKPTERHQTKIHTLKTMLENARVHDREARQAAIRARQNYTGR